MTAPAKFKQGDVTRAIKGAKAAGFKVAKFEIDANGKIVIYTDRAANDDGPSDWDGL